MSQARHEIPAFPGCVVANPCADSRVKGARAGAAAPSIETAMLRTVTATGERPKRVGLPA
jgi:hypothetical protein